MPLYDPSYDPNDDYKTRHKKTDMFFAKLMSEERKKDTLARLERDRQYLKVLRETYRDGDLEENLYKSELKATKERISMNERMLKQKIASLRNRIARLEKTASKGLDDLYDVVSKNNFRIRLRNYEAKISKVEKFKGEVVLEIKLSEDVLESSNHNDYYDQADSDERNTDTIQDILSDLFSQLSPFFDSFRYDFSGYKSDNTVYLDSVEHDFSFYEIKDSSFEVGFEEA